MLARRIAGSSVDDIAAALGSTRAAVHAVQHAALVALRSEIGGVAVRF
ncbi:hypothetical protein [Pseudonocardia sp. GCM10023141]